jgi:uncharacterized protein YlxP (DUF503 family)
MYVAALRVDLRIRNVHSLKEKRRIVKSLKAHLTNTFEAAVAEVDHQELWQRATLGVAVVAPQAGQADRILHSVRRALDQREEIEVLGTRTAYLEDSA